MRASRANVFLIRENKPGLLLPNGLGIFVRYDKSAHRLQVIKYLCARYAKIYTDRMTNKGIWKGKHSEVISQSQCRQAGESFSKFNTLLST